MVKLEEAVKNAKLFYETVKLAWGFQVTYCYHDLIQCDLWPDNKDDASEKEEQRQNIIDNDNETKDEIRIISNIKNFYTFRLPPPVSDQPTTEEFIQHYAQNYSSSRKPSNLKKHLVKSYAKP